MLSEFDVAIKRMTVMALQTRKESDEEIEKARTAADCCDKPLQPWIHIMKLFLY